MFINTVLFVYIFVNLLFDRSTYYVHKTNKLSISTYKMLY